MRRHAFAATISALAMAATMTFGSLSALAAPRTMSDGGLFDAQYYAAANPDVVAALGTDENTLYQHYKLFGAAEGRQPYQPAVSAVSEATKARVGAIDLPLNTQINITLKGSDDPNGLWYRFVLNDDRTVKIHSDIIDWVSREAYDLYDEAGQLIYNGMQKDKELALGRGSYFINAYGNGAQFLEVVQEDKLDGTFVQGGRSKEAAVGIPLNAKIYGTLSHEEADTTGRWYFFQLTAPQKVQIANDVHSWVDGGKVNVYDANENLLFNAAQDNYNNGNYVSDQVLPAGIYYVKVVEGGQRNFALRVW